jgi:NADPH:quinone reductase-like Zn-dependent oxidoreductase
MKAIVMHSFGGSEVLESEDIPRPSPKSGEVLIKVQAAGVNPVDYKIRSGEFAKKETKLPAVPGRDVSGTVESIGRGVVTGLKPGDEVYAFLKSHSGGYAGFAIAQQNEVALKPESLDHAHAAGVPLAALTAWQALFDHGQMRAGQRVLIHGGAGGVGHFAVQFAKVRDATVIATAERDDIPMVESLGADQVIDYKGEAFEKQTSDIDLVIDLIGGEIQERSWDVLRSGGALISTLKEPSKTKAAQHNVRTKVFMTEANSGQLTEIARLIDEGKVNVVVQKTYDLDEAAQAQDELEYEHSIGKRVLTVA